MAGPGGVEVARASIKITPNVDEVFRKLESLAKSIERVEFKIPTSLNLEHISTQMNELRARTEALDLRAPLHLESSLSQVRTVTREMQAVATLNPVKVPIKTDTKALSSLKAGLASIKLPNLGALAGVGKAGGIASLGITAAGSVPQILALTSSLAELSGLAGLLPGVVGAGAASIGTLAIGLQGFGTALKDSADPTKFAEALKKLAPNAQAAAKAISGLRPAFDSVRLDIQNKLFAGASDSIRKLSDQYLPILKKRLGDIGGGFSSAFSSFAQAATAGRVLSDVQASLRSASGALTPFLAGITALVPAFSSLTRVGSSFLPQLAQGFAGVAKQFSSFLQISADDGSLAKFIQGGIDALKQLGSIASSAGAVVFGIFTAAQAAGGGTLATLSKLLSGIADVVNGPAFQKGLTGFFQGVSQGASGLLAGALPAIGQILASLGPQIGQLAAQLGPVLGQAFVALAPLLQTFASTALTAFSALLPSVSTVVTTISTALLPVFVALGSAMQTLAPVIGQIAVVIAQQLAAALLAIAPQIPAIAAAFTQLLVALTPLLPALGQVLLQAITTLLPTLPQMITGFTQLVQQVTPALPLFVTLAGYALQLAGVLARTVGPALSFVARNFGTVSQAVSPITQQITAVIDIFQSLASNVSAAVGAVTTTVQNMGPIISAAVSGFGSLLFQSGTNIVDGLIRGIGSMGGRLASFVRQFVADHIPAPVAKAMGIASPSKVMAAQGRWIALGLAKGISDNAGAVSDASRMVAAQASLSSRQLIGSGVAAVGANGAGGAVIFNGNVGWDPGTVAQQIEIKRRDAVVANSLRLAVG